MAPSGSRKRVNPSPPGADSPSNDHGSTSGTVNDRPGLQTQGSGKNSYPGSWLAGSKVSSKAAPVTEVAHESVASNNAFLSSSTSLHDLPKHNRHNPSLQLTRKAGTSSRSLPADVTTTRVNVASDNSASSAPTVDDSMKPAEPTSQSHDKGEARDKATDTENDASEEDRPTATETNPPNTENADDKTAGPETTTTPETQTGGWLSWFYSYLPSMPGGYDSSDSASPEPAPEPPVEERNPNERDNKQDNKAPEEQGPEEQESEEQGRPDERAGTSPQPPKRSWFQMWSGGGSSSSSQKAEEPPREDARPVADESPRGTDTESLSDKPNDKPKEAETIPRPHTRNAKSSGWSFWSRDAPKDSASGTTQDVEAVEASTTQDTSRQLNGAGSKPDVQITRKGSFKANKQKGGVEVPAATISDGGAENKPVTLPPKGTEATASKQLQSVLPNDVLPHFKDTFAMQGPPSLFQTIGRFLHYTKEPENQHVYVVRDPPRIRRALAIGVHGYFPAPLIRSVLGQPTGTSVRFSSMAASAIKKWTSDHGYECDIEKISLEGEGRIAERVSLLWKLLLNWMEEIRKADFILFACHSQGVPVTIMLIAKLIAFGCLDAARVGVCAMAGVNLGPFPDFKSRWISGSAGELFEFALHHSRVSKDYEESLKRALDFGVRISYVGSIDDQLVSLESSLFSPVSHPYVYRAVFVDGRVHAPSFLSHLVGFILKLRNLGISDHGLIRELSSPLAGSLYSGEGHSRIYDDGNVYYLAVEFALETSTVSNANMVVKRTSYPPSPNPYILPFSMRGLLEEDYVRRELYQETMELLRQFDDWKPSSKVLKDVKFRLEGIRSKL